MFLQWALAFPENLLEERGKGRVTQPAVTIKETKGHIMIASAVLHAADAVLGLTLTSPSVFFSLATEKQITY